MSALKKKLGSRRGSVMTEAAISLPIVILAAMLMLRLFIFYLQILTTGIDEHKRILKEQDAYRGALLRTYTEEKKVSMLRGGLLKSDAAKRLEIKAYMINEDMLVRSSELLGQ